MRNALVVWLVLSSVGCGLGHKTAPAKASPSPTIDQARFEPLYRSGKAVEGAMSTGVSLIQFSELLQNLATEVGIAKDKATRPDELAMVGRFNEALATLVLSRQTWQDSNAEDAQQIWAIALPMLQAASRTYFSDAAGAKAAIAEAEAAQTRWAQEVATRGARVQKAVVAARAEQEKLRRVEILAGSLTNPDAETRLRSCKELAKMGTAASMYNGNIKDVMENDADARVRAACAALWKAIAPALQ